MRIYIRKFDTSLVELALDLDGCATRTAPARRQITDHASLFKK
jgi:hypothetical protein